MCHFALMMPVLGLGVFWLAPLDMALPIYGIILAVSLAIYIPMMRAMQRPVETGAEGMLHKIDSVIEPIHPEGRVKVHGEIWQATSAEELQAGDRAEIIAVEGLTLKVRKLEKEA